MNTKYSYSLGVVRHHFVKSKAFMFICNLKMISKKSSMTSTSFYMALTLSLILYIPTGPGYTPSERDPNEGLGCCVYLLTWFSWLLVILTFPLSLCVTIKVRNDIISYHVIRHSLCFLFTRRDLSTCLTLTMRRA